MARKKKFDFSIFFGMLIGLIVSIGVGDLFIEGTFLGSFALRYLPLLAHQIVGWVIIIGSIWAFGSYLYNKLN